MQALVQIPVGCLQSPWKLLLILMLCDTYLKWTNLHHDGLVKDSESSESGQNAEDSIFYAAVEWDFYRMFLVTLSGEGEKLTSTRFWLRKKRTPNLKCVQVLYVILPVPMDQNFTYSSFLCWSHFWDVLPVPSSHVGLQAKLALCRVAGPVWCNVDFGVL